MLDKAQITKTSPASVDMTDSSLATISDSHLQETMKARGQVSEQPSLANATLMAATPMLFADLPESDAARFPTLSEMDFEMVSRYT